MSKGWECPKCGKVYAPFVQECAGCNKEPTKQSSPDYIWYRYYPGIHYQPFKWPYDVTCTVSASTDATYLSQN